MKDTLIRPSVVLVFSPKARLAYDAILSYTVIPLQPDDPQSHDSQQWTNAFDIGRPANGTIQNADFNPFIMLVTHHALAQAIGLYRPFQT